MTGTGGVLSLLSDPMLAEEVDRIAAAVGLRVIHGDPGAPLHRKTWLAATAVLLDDAGARDCARRGHPRRDHVSVLTAADPTAATWAAAVAVGAQRVLRLPDQETGAIAALAEAEETSRGVDRGGRIVAVVGGCGGAGASVLAAALAQCAADALLVDLDPCGGGIDLLMAGGPAPGLRWTDLTLRGGRLTWTAVRDALPVMRGAVVLSAPRHCHDLEAGPVQAVLDAGRRGGATVVCDVARRMTDATEAAVAAADLVVVVSRCDVRAAAATAAFTPVVTAINPTAGLVVRGPAPGGLRAGEIAELVAVPLLAAMRADPGVDDQIDGAGLRVRRRSGLAAAARRVLDVLGSGRIAESAA